uniref:Deoxyribonuclease TATDN1 n=1 Tax=Parastrongyloides trichosuri TaxID=131310 RepID=A0A0N4ZTD0_PARTI
MFKNRLLLFRQISDQLKNMTKGSKPLPDISSIKLNHKLVDIGCNLGHPSFKHDLEEVLQRANQAGVEKIMITGPNVSGSKEICELSRSKPGLFYFTAGVHPHEAKEFDNNTLSEISKLLKEPHCVASGECGLDYNRMFSTKDEQLICFEEQLKLACEFKKPLFLHEREAHEDMVRLLTKYQEQLPPAVIHCFTGTAEEAKQYISMGLYIGLTGFLAKDKSDNGVQHALKNRIIPLNRLMIETDAPYMFCNIGNKKLKQIKEKMSEEAKALHKYSSFERNEPCAMAAIVEVIAHFMGESVEKVAEETSRNSKLVFGLE